GGHRVSTTHRPAQREDVGTLARRFAEALDAVGGRTHPVRDEESARAEVARICAERPALADRDPVLESVVAGLTRVEDPWQAQVGVTTATAAAAETGTIVLVFDTDHPRSTGLVPPVHVAVVPADRLLPTYQDAVDHLGTLRPLPSGVRFTTGPSSSGDIELTLVRGMHGPVELHVVLVGFSPDEPGTPSPARDDNATAPDDRETA
ncbi:MAG: LUD domain-containing protein, partial [Actinomycetes bacterium]